jgi:hypothetical protein
MLHKLPKPIFALLVLPLFYVGLAIFQVNKLQPLYFGVDTFDYDAAYSYLISSISLTIGDVPHFADHPGTLNHIAIAFALRCYQIFILMTDASSQLCTTTSCIALDHSEAVLNLAGNFTLSLFSLSVFFWGWSLYKSSLASIWICCLSQAVFLSVLNLLPFFKIINGETAGVPLLLVGASVSLLSNSLATSQARPSQNKNALLIAGGCLSGMYFSLMLLSKLSFLPAVLLLALNYSNIAFVSSLVSISAGFFLWGMKFTDWSRFKQYWMLISTHTGSYGAGAKGLIDFQQASEGVVSVVTKYPFIPITIVLLCVALFFALRITPPSLIRISFVRSGSKLVAASMTAYGLAFCKSNFQTLVYVSGSLLVVYLLNLSGRFRDPKQNCIVVNNFSQSGHRHVSRLVNPENRLESLLILCLCQLLSVMAVVKHFDERYLLAPVAITAISIGLALGLLESCKDQASKSRLLTKTSLKLVIAFLFISIVAQGAASGRLLGQKINERNDFMNYDLPAIARARLMYPNAEFIGEYRIKGVPEFAKAFAFIMASNQKKANHIMSFYSDPRQRFWIWKSGAQKIWNSRDSEITVSEFPGTIEQYGGKRDFIFAIPDGASLPPLNLVKIATLKQKAGLFFYAQN